MSSTCIALALVTGVDVHGLRQLHDYGGLNDADVIRAFEQTRVQRFGHVRMPVYLKRIEQAAYVIDDGCVPRVEIHDAHSDEAQLLSSLQDALDTAAGPCVVWDVAELRPLTARAMRHDTVLPAALRDGSALGLVDVFTDRAPNLSDAIEAEADISRLFDLEGTEAKTTTALARALDRYRLWLAWQYSQGALSAAERDARHHALAENRPPSTLSA